MPNSRRRGTVAIIVAALSTVVSSAAAARAPTPMRSRPSPRTIRPGNATRASRVSVVIPAYNASQTIGRAIDSVLAQTAAPHEIIVVDDGSRDDLAAAVARYGDAVTLTRQPNGGVSSARNTGLARATGDLIAFLDADDTWEAHKLAHQLAVLDAHPEVGMVGATLYLEEVGRPGREVDPAIDQTMLDRVLEPDGPEAFHAAGMFWTGTVLVRRDVLEEARFDESLSTAEDREMWLRLLLRAPAWLCGEPLATCVLVPGSLSRSSIDRDCTNMLALLERCRVLLGEDAHARWTADVHRRWSAGLLREGAPRAALVPALAHLRRAPSGRALWTVVKSAALAATTPPPPPARVASAVTIEQLEQATDLRALEIEWRELHERTRAYRPSTTWDWLATWWEVFGEGRTLRVLVAREGGRLIGIAPLQLRTVRDLGVSVRRLELLASGEPESDEIFSEYLDFVIEVGREREVVAALWRHLAGSEDWDELRLASVPAESRLRAALRDASAGSRFDLEEHRRADAVVVPLAASPAAFLTAQSKKMREDLRRHRRMLEQLGEVRLERAETLEDLRRMFPVFARLHQELWQSRGKPGCFASAQFTRFHDLLAERMHARGMVHLHVLHVGDRPIAARYGFDLGGRMFEYQSGLDPTFEPRISTGMVAGHLCMEAAIAGGFMEYDLGEGPRPYKLRWNHLRRQTFDVSVTRRGPRTWLHRRAEDAVARLKEAREAVHAVRYEDDPTDAPQDG